ncbi:hypothetical protein [Paenibacillus sp. SAF-054]|uniref:hypothetical protein n=1 Tax=Paenibacillus sp. SAF-054 TaxID=3436863 RepID=UPI003F7E444E
MRTHWGSSEHKHREDTLRSQPAGLHPSWDVQSHSCEWLCLILPTKKRSGRINSEEAAALAFAPEF